MELIGLSDHSLFRFGHRAGTLRYFRDLTIRFSDPLM
jgi:hypothetical protein